MSAYELFVLNYNYSSWSMRAGVLMRFSGAAFRESVLHYDEAGLAEMRRLSPSGTLPLLAHGGLRIGDSLAIAEYLAEEFPDKPFWPRDKAARALARSACAEMHSSFHAMRNTMNMNIRARYPGFARSPEVDANVRRVQALWGDLRSRFAAHGDFLCGEFGTVDAFFAPVVTRFRTYDVKLGGELAAYAERLLEHPAVAGWLEKAAADPLTVPKYDYVVG
jgi:glutathione S-transferase